MHRYLTDGEAARCLDTRKTAGNETISIVPQGIESTRSATYVFKRLLNLLFQHSDRFLPEVTALWEASEKQLVDDCAHVSRTARVLLAVGETDLATKCLTYFSKTELIKALDVAERLAQAYEIRTRALYGFSRSTTPTSPEQIW